MATKYLPTTYEPRHARAVTGSDHARPNSGPRLSKLLPWVWSHRTVRLLVLDTETVRQTWRDLREWSGAFRQSRADDPLMDGWLTAVVCDETRPDIPRTHAVNLSAAVRLRTAGYVVEWLTDQLAQAPPALVLNFRMWCLASGITA